MTFSKAPCLGCSDRSIEPNCHTNCERYAQWQKLREPMHKVKTQTNLFSDYLHSKNVRMHVQEDHKGWV